MVAMGFDLSLEPCVTGFTKRLDVEWIEEEIDVALVRYLVVHRVSLGDITDGQTELTQRLG